MISWRAWLCRQGAADYAAVSVSFWLPGGLTLLSVAEGDDLPDGYVFETNVYVENSQNFVSIVAHSPLGAGTFTGDAELFSILIGANVGTGLGERSLGIQILYIMEDATGTTPYPSDQVVGWLVPDSTLQSDIEGVTYLGLLMNHGATIQLSTQDEPVVTQASTWPKMKALAGRSRPRRIRLAPLRHRTQTRHPTKRLVRTSDCSTGAPP